MKKDSFLKDKKAIFIGTSIMLEKCIEFSLKKFKNIYVLTDDKKITKKLKNKINLVNIKDLNKFNFDYLFSILNHKIIPYKNSENFSKYPNADEHSKNLLQLPINLSEKNFLKLSDKKAKIQKALEVIYS